MDEESATSRATPPIAAVADALLGEARFTPLDVAARTGVPIERLRRLWRALGFPPVPEEERAFTAADIAVVDLLGSSQAELWLADDGVLQVARVLGQAMARLAETQVSLVATRIGAAAAPAQLNQLELTEPFLGYVWRRHLVSALGRELPLVGESGRVERGLVVGFADLVDFTTLSHGLDGDGIAQVVDRFEALAYEHIPEHRGRVIKMIGDEVMFVAEDAAAAAEIALGLVEAHAADPAMPDIRVGLAVGPVVGWEGDLFGPTVNLASRLVKFAKPASIVVTTAVADAIAADGRFRVQQLRRRARLKGFDKVPVAIVARAAT